MNQKQLIKEIRDGKNLEVNLPIYAQKYMDKAYQYALVQLTLKYYTLYEVMLEKKNIEEKNIKDILEIIQNTIKISLFETFHAKKTEDAIKKLDHTRNEVMKQMRILTYYTDAFEIYEYVLNRIEPRFQEDRFVPNEEVFIKKLVKHIFSSKENAIINENIKEVLGQLPVRITKAKFFELVKNSLSIYKGAMVSSIESYFYMLRTSGMLDLPEGIDSNFTKYQALLKQLEKIDFKTISQQEYENAAKEIKIAAKEIRNIVDFYVNLQEIINYLYVILLSIPYANLQADKITDAFCFVIQNLYYRFQTGTKEEIPEEITKELEWAEGEQEQLWEDCTFFESALYEIKTSFFSMIESMMLKTIFNRLFYIEKLLSSSIFIELEKEEKKEIIDNYYIEKETKILLAQFSDLFKKNQKYVNRAVMAAVMNKMPVFFNSVKEVEDYIQHSLEQCRDKEEKIASMNLLNSFISEGKEND